MVYFRPSDLEEALQWLAQNDGVIAAGCTDLFPATSAPQLTQTILDITAIEALRGISEETDFWSIGATTSWTDVIRADLPPAFDALKLAAREVGSIQIQNAGTVAGNLCNASPAADGVPPLLVLDARVELSSAKGTRELPLSEFLTGPRETQRKTGEILTRILIPKESGEGISHFSKLGARKYLVISISMVAARLVVSNGQITQAAISVGACSAVATRLKAVERALVGQSFNASIVDAITPEQIYPVLSPIDDVRADHSFRRDASCTLVKRVVQALVDDTMGGAA